MRFAAGTTLDLCDPVLPYRAIALEGVPSVYGGDLEIAESWTLSAGDVEAGYRLSTNGRLLFMKGVTIRVTTEDFIRRPPEGGWVIAEAEGGISLPEDWRSGLYPVAAVTCVVVHRRVLPGEEILGNGR